MYIKNLNQIYYKFTEYQDLRKAVSLLIIRSIDILEILQLLTGIFDMIGVCSSIPICKFYEIYACTLIQSYNSSGGKLYIQYSQYLISLVSSFMSRDTLASYHSCLPQNKNLIYLCPANSDWMDFIVKLVLFILIFLVIFQNKQNKFHKFPIKLSLHTPFPETTASIFYLEFSEPEQQEEPLS